jgi:hypothetical protein
LTRGRPVSPVEVVHASLHRIERSQTVLKALATDAGDVGCTSRVWAVQAGMEVEEAALRLAAALILYAARSAAEREGCGVLAEWLETAIEGREVAKRGAPECGCSGQAVRRSAA